MNVFRGSKRTGVLSDAFSTLFLSLNDYDSPGNAICGICYMADGRHFVRIALSGPGTGTIYTAHESAEEKSKSSVIATITSDEGDVYAIENYSSFGVDKLTFHELLSFEMKNFSSDYITSHGPFGEYGTYSFVQVVNETNFFSANIFPYPSGKGNHYLTVLGKKVDPLLEGTTTSKITLLAFGLFMGVSK